MEDEKKTIVSESDDVLMQNSYPSPTTDPPDVHFYHIQPREHEMDNESDQLVQQALANLAEHNVQQNHNHVHEHDHDEDLRELQALQESQPPEPQHQVQGEQHQEHHPASADELQLVAQLSHDLAPIMAEAAQSQSHTHAQGQQQLPPPPENAHMQEAHGQVDPDLHQQLQVELQNHDQELQNILPPGEQPGGMNSEHQYHNSAPSPGPHGLPAMPLETYQYPVDNTPPRKRSKVSRACDECRRKKIKCDAQSDAIDQPCSNCRRSSAQCLFSRVPQKRGPSKGYIKELADRINTIEGKLGGSVESVLESAVRRTPTEVFPSPQPVDESRKRPFSSISGDGFPTPISTSGRGPPWSTEHRAIRPYIPPEPSLPYSVNDLAPKTPAPVSLVNSDPIPVRAEPNILDEIPDSLHQDPLQQAEPVREIEDSVFNCYLANIHPTFPVLARTKARVQSLISQCPPSLQDAFCDAVLDFARPFLRLSALFNGETGTSTQQSLTEWELERHPRSPATDLVYFQTTVMMALDQEYRGRLRSSPGPALLGKAAGLGYSLRLHLATPDSVPSPELDPDSDHNVALRAWWTLVAFDRWNAIGTGVPTIISNETAVILPGLKHIVGEGVYQLIQLSNVIGSFVPLANGRPPKLDLESARVLGMLTTSTIEQFRLQFPMVLEEARFQHVHLGYWHTRLLSDMFSPQSRIPFLLQDCSNIIRLLASNPQLLGPLNHHFVTLASLVLVELARIAETRDEATKLIRDILDCGMVSSPWNTAVRDKIAETLPAPTRDATASGAGINDVNVKNLQQLADVATAVDGALGSSAPVPGPTPAPAPAPAQDDAAPEPHAPPPPTSIPALMSGGDAALDDGLTPVPVRAPPSAIKTEHVNHIGAGGHHVFDSRPILRVGYLTFLERGDTAG